MRIDCEDVRRLASACRGAGEDLFCIVGVTPGFDALASLYILPEEPTLLLLPGTFAAPERLTEDDLTARFSRSGFPALRACVLTDGILTADVRLLGDEAFRSFCENRGIRHLLVPFAELADGTEYGHRAAYGWIGEWRASLPYALRVTALFSAAREDYGPLIARFASPGCTVIDASCEPSVFAYETADVRKKYAFTAALAQRHAARRTAVFFTDRREAEEFRRFLQKGGVDSIYVNGGMAAPALRDALESFRRGEGLLLATKSALASCLFYRADEAIFCGAPYSAAFIARCASFAQDGALSCCLCQKDLATDINILKHFAGNRPPEEREAFLTDTLQKLLAVKQLLTEPE